MRMPSVYLYLAGRRRFFPQAPGRALRWTALMALVALLAAGGAGCVVEAPPNVDWATPEAGEVTDGGIQPVFDAYAAALLSKDREAFLKTVDEADPAFRELQARMFDRLKEVPFSQYRIEVTSQSENAPGVVIAKVEIAFTYRESFTELPDPDRAAFFVTRRDEGWKLSGDATEQALGKPKNAGLEDFGAVRTLVGQKVIVFYLDSQAPTAEQIAGLTDAAFPRLEAAMPGVELPKITVRLFDSKEQIDRVFPGKWTEWTGGASRQLGGQSDQGGEIIVDSQTYNDVNGYAPDYNPKMLAHELTHIALFPLSGPRTPPFLVEGLADYVAGDQEAFLLEQKLQSGEAFSPTLRDLYRPGSFSALLTTEAAALAYEQSDTAVALLESRYGNEKVLELMKEFKRRGDEEIDQDGLVDSVFRDVLGTGWDGFEAEWRRFAAGG